MTDMDYVSFGNGKKNLCILPGVALKRVLLSANSVKAQYKPLLNDFTIYLFECKNNISQGYSIEEMASDTVAKMRELGIEKTSLFGVSKGGMMAQVIAGEYPEITEKVVMFSTCSRQNETSEKCLNRWISLAREKKYGILAREMIENLYTEDFVKKCGDVLVNFFLDTSDEDARRFIIQCEASAKHNYYDKLKKIKCPALVLGAKYDSVLDPVGSKEIAEALGCDIYLYDKPYNHACYDEIPDLCDRLLDFLL